MSQVYDPSTEFSTDESITASEVANRPHSWREYDPKMFIHAAKNSGKGKARDALRRVEDGRFYEMLKYAHRFFGPLDADERETFANRNPDLMAWMAAYGYLEDLTAYSDYSGMDPWEPLD
jgi:hypothetical protein